MPGLGAPRAQTLGGPPLPYGGSLWALTQAVGQGRGPLVVPASCGEKVAPLLQVVSGLVIPWQQSFPPLPEASPVVVKVVGFFLEYLARETLYLPIPLSLGLIRMITMLALT